MPDGHATVRRAVSQVFESRTQNRRLQWAHTLGSVLVAATLPHTRQPLPLAMSTLQLCIVNMLAPVWFGTHRGGPETQARRPTSLSLTQILHRLLTDGDPPADDRA